MSRGRAGAAQPRLSYLSLPGRSSQHGHHGSQGARREPSRDPKGGVSYASKPAIRLCEAEQNRFLGCPTPREERGRQEPAELESLPPPGLPGSGRTELPRNADLPRSRPRDVRGGALQRRRPWLQLFDPAEAAPRPDVPVTQSGGHTHRSLQAVRRVLTSL